MRTPVACTSLAILALSALLAGCTGAPPVFPSDKKSLMERFVEAVDGPRPPAAPVELVEHFYKLANAGDYATAMALTFRAPLAGIPPPKPSDKAMLDSLTKNQTIIRFEARAIGSDVTVKVNYADGTTATRTHIVVYGQGNMHIDLAHPAALRAVSAPRAPALSTTLETKKP